MIPQKLQERFDLWQRSEALESEDETNEVGTCVVSE
jgi:hypothetical protein